MTTIVEFYDKQQIDGLLESVQEGSNTHLRLAGTAGEELVAPCVVYSAMGSLLKASASDTTELVEAILGVVLEDTPNGMPADCIRAGSVTHPSWSWSDGPVWLGEAGALTQTPPAADHDVLLGTAISPTEVVLSLQDPISLEEDGNVLSRVAGRLRQVPLPSLLDGLQLPWSMTVSCSVGSTPIVLASDVATFRLPFDVTLTEVRASLGTAQVSGTEIEVDVRVGVSSIFTTPITIENGERTSVTSLTPAVLDTTEFTSDDELIVDVTAIGDGTAAELRLTLIGTTPWHFD